MVIGFILKFGFCRFCFWMVEVWWSFDGLDVDFEIFVGFWLSFWVFCGL